MTLQCGVIAQLTQARETHHHVTMDQNMNEDILYARPNGLSFERHSTERINGEHLAKKVYSSSRNIPLHAKVPANDSTNKKAIPSSDRIEMSSLGIGVQVPRKSDIIFGRGGGTNFHPGNMEYRRKIKMRQKEYIDARQRATKSEIISEIIKEVRAEGGRFLKQDENTKLWYEVDEKEVKKKTSQTLREGAPQWRKSQGEWMRREEQLKNGNTSFTSSVANPQHGSLNMSNVDCGLLTNNVNLLISGYDPTQSLQKKAKVHDKENKRANGLDLLSDVALFSTTKEN